MADEQPDNDDKQPDDLTTHDALQRVRVIASDTGNIIVVEHANKRMRQRSVTRRQIELCIQKGTICEGPYVDAHGNWRMMLFRHAAGEELRCVVAIDWPARLIVVTVF